MARIDSLDALEALYGTPVEGAIRKVTRALTPSYRRWIEAARFCVVASIGPEGTDASPRGDDGPVVKVLDARRLALPDWPGNQRIDSLRNIVADGRVSLMFMVAGSDIVMRVNGRAALHTDPELVGLFEDRGRQPRLVMVVTLDEVYPQCPKALMRADLWQGAAAPEGLPSMGEMLREVTEGAVDAEAFDAEAPAMFRAEMW